MDFITKFETCGYLHQSTNIEHLRKVSKTSKITAYIGFDCTAKSLHVGNLMQIMILRLLQQYGHKPIVIIGGATTKIGDPSGKDEVRKIITDEEIQENINGIKKSLAKFIKFGEGENNVLLLNNQQWLNSLNYIEFLRDYGKFFSVNKMLTMDSVKLRLERNHALSFLELNYMLLQSYDFYYLNKNYNCNLQIGGSDQWGNIIMGTDLIRRLSNNEAFGLTTPLVTTSTGSKMGKTASGAVWLNEDMCLPYDYFQYWRNIDDKDIMKFAKFYGEFHKEELDELKYLCLKNINLAKKKVAYKITLLCHGKEAADIALNTAIQTFEHRKLDKNLPTFTVKKHNIQVGIPIIELLIIIGLVQTKSEGKRLIRNNGIKINNNKISNEKLIIKQNYFVNELIKISSGKKSHILVKIEPD